MSCHLKQIFRILTTYLMVFSLLWQNCVWAVGDLVIVEEDLLGFQAHVFQDNKIAVVEASNLKNNAVHNVFDDLQILEGSGLVLRSTPKTQTIYNRIYSPKHVHLAGIIESEHTVPIIFANPGGLILSNPDFHNINKLYLIAGTLAQTNEGMAYAIDDGDVHIQQMVIEQDSLLEKFLVAGRHVTIQHSLLAPANKLTINAGQHLQVLKGDQLAEGLQDTETPDVTRSSITLNSDTILNSQSLHLRSWEHSASLHLQGLLYASAKDITIQARGDIYLDKFFAYRNLKIATTGKVFLGSQGFVGGIVDIQASDIEVSHDLHSLGSMFLKASHKISLSGKLSTQNDITLAGATVYNKGIIETPGLLTSPHDFFNQIQGIIKARSLSSPLSLLSRNEGQVRLEDSIHLSPNNARLGGTIHTQGKFTAVGQGTLTVEGKIHAQNGIQVDLNQLINKGLITALGSGLQGNLQKLHNEGGLDCSQAHVTIKQTHNTSSGAIRSREHFIMQGDHYRNDGKVFTCGIHHAKIDGHYEDQGTFYSPQLAIIQAQTLHYGSKHRSFLKDALLTSSQDITLDEGASLQMEGDQDKCFLQIRGQQNIHCHGRIQQFAATRFPLMDYFNLVKSSLSQQLILCRDFAQEIAQQDLGHWISLKRSLGSGIVLHANHNIDCNKSTIQPESGNVSLIARGQLLTDHAHIKTGYFRSNDLMAQGKVAVFKDTELASFAGKIRLWAIDKMSLINVTAQGYQTSLSANNVTLHNSTVQSRLGTMQITGHQQVHLHNAHVLGQHLTAIHSDHSIIQNSSVQSSHGATIIDGNKKVTVTDRSYVHGAQMALLQAPTVGIKDSRVSSSSGAVIVESKERVSITRSQIEADKQAEVYSCNTHINNSQIKSHNAGINIVGSDLLTLHTSLLQAKEPMLLMGKNIDLKQSHLESQHDAIVIAASEQARIDETGLRGKNINLEAQNGLILSMSQLISEYNKLTAQSVTAQSTSIKGITLVNATQDANLHETQSQDDIVVSAPRIHFSGLNAAQNIQVQGQSIKNTGDIKSRDNLYLNGNIVAQHGSTSAHHNSTIIAQNHYDDSYTSKNTAGNTLALIAEQNRGFNGRQKAETLVVKLTDMNLQQLLSQTTASVMEVHLKQGEVFFDTDFVLNRTLYLWAKCLTNKAQFTATHDFIAHIQTNLLNQGSMTIFGKGLFTAQEGITTSDITTGQSLELKTAGTLHNVGILEGSDVTIKGKQIITESSVYRHFHARGYQDQLQKEVGMRARTGDLTVEAGSLLQARGAKFEAKFNLNLKSAGSLYLGAQQLASNHRSSNNNSQHLTHYKTQLNSGRNTNVESGETIVFEGIDAIAGGQIHVNSGGTFNNNTVHNLSQSETRTQFKKGLLRKKCTHIDQESSSTVVPNTFKANGTVHFESQGDNIQCAPHIESNQAVIIESHQGKVALKADYSESHSASHTQKRSLVWQSQHNSGQSHRSVTMPHIIAKQDVMVSSPQRIDVDFRESKFANSLEVLARNPATAWVKDLCYNPHVQWHLLSEDHRHWSRKVQGLTPAASLVIGLAVNLATYGVGAELMGLLS